MKRFGCLIILCILLLASCNSKVSNYHGRVDELFNSVWTKYRVHEYGLFSEHYPSSYRPDLTYFQDSTQKTQEVSYLWPMSGLFSAVNVLAEYDFEKYSIYLDSMVMAVEKYYDNSRTPAGYQAYPTMFDKVDRYYDDNGLVGIDYVDAYFITKKVHYLEKAKEVMTFIKSGWWDDYGGAVSWLEGHRDQKPACSNGKAAVLSLKLYEATKDSSYLELGKRFYDWMIANLEDDSLHIIWNSLLTDKGEIQKHAYTYNTGTMIQTAVRLFKATGDSKYLKDAERLAYGSFSYYVRYMDNGIPYIKDLPWFIVVLFRGYQDLYEVNGNPKYINAIISSANWAWENARDNSGLIYNDWTGISDEKSTPKWLLDEACMIELYARIAMIDINNDIKK